MNKIAIKNKQAEETAREILEEISNIFEDYISNWVFWYEEDIYNSITKTIREKYLFESDIYKNLKSL